MDDRLIQQLQSGLKQPLPGQEAQYRMAHVVRRRVEPPPAHAKQAAVLALFYPLEERWHLVFIERQSLHPEDRHAGQISFPGGRQEPSDTSLQETALREAEEEVGLDRKQVEVLGRLTHLYIPVSNYLVNPFVGMTQQTPQFTPEETEVRDILQVPLQHLMYPDTKQQTDLQLSQNITLRNVPYFNLDGKVLWGATAMIVNELLTILNN
mgnify:CR=1 FL=1